MNNTVCNRYFWELLGINSNLFAVRVTKEGNTTTVEGVVQPDPKEHLFLKPDANGACPVCSTGIDLKHTVSSFWHTLVHESRINQMK